MRALALTLLLASVPGPARADALGRAAFTVLLVRANPTAEGRRAALETAFDAAAPSAAPAEELLRGRSGPRRAWFPRRLADAQDDAPALRVPALPAAAPEAGLLVRAASAVRAALAPWRALADAVWGGAWAGAVRAGVARGPHR